MVDFNLTAFLSQYSPIFKWGSIIFVVILIFGGLYYYFIVLGRRRKWHLRIMEQKSDGRLHLIGTDLLIEKKINMGRRTFYWLTKAKQEATPPPWEATDRLGNKDYADYLRIRCTYLPITKAIEGKIDYSNPTGVANQNMRVRSEKALFAMRNDPRYKTSLFNADSVAGRFIYVPINKVPHVSVGYMQLEYDVDMMRINQIDNIDAMFASQAGFWQKYGQIIILAILVVAIIVVAYLSFDYMRGVISDNLQTTNGVIDAIKRLAPVSGAPPG